MRNGALILSGVSVVFGCMFAILIALFEGAAPSDGALGYWLWLIGSTIVIWGFGGVFFGAILGLYASMIWPD